MVKKVSLRLEGYQNNVTQADKFRCSLFCSQCVFVTKYSLQVFTKKSHGCQMWSISHAVVYCFKSHTHMTRYDALHMYCREQQDEAQLPWALAHVLGRGFVLWVGGGLVAACCLYCNLVPNKQGIVNVSYLKVHYGLNRHWYVLIQTGKARGKGKTFSWLNPT